MFTWCFTLSNVYTRKEQAALTVISVAVLPATFLELPLKSNISGGKLNVCGTQGGGGGGLISPSVSLPPLRILVQVLQWELETLLCRA